MIYTPQEYDRIRKLVIEGKVSDNYWTEYCTNYLMIIMEENRDVFERLKDR